MPAAPASGAPEESVGRGEPPARARPPRPPEATRSRPGAGIQPTGEGAAAPRSRPAARGEARAGRAGREPRIRGPRRGRPRTLRDERPRERGRPAMPSRRCARAVRRRSRGGSRGAVFRLALGGRRGRALEKRNERRPQGFERAHEPAPYLGLRDAQGLGGRGRGQARDAGQEEGRAFGGTAGPRWPNARGPSGRPRIRPASARGFRGRRRSFRPRRSSRRFPRETRGMEHRARSGASSRRAARTSRERLPWRRTARAFVQKMHRPADSIASRGA